MSTQQARVALFIDWDNLAISTAADLGGAVPDVRAIVQRAQQFGMLIIAKAYAEWQANSERLAVYRAGIEPAYAPTFRFEPDSATQQGKGKSLADPCMVADCIDTLHLFPDIGVYILVTGDKDMIPVVRLAQMRGRKVVVIGPDYVAGVLREMADEFIPYRSLVEGAPTRPEPVRRYSGTHAPSDEPLRRRHPSPTPFARQERITSTVMPAAPPAPIKPPTRPEAAEAPVEAAEEGAQPDLPTVFGLIVDILRQRGTEGRDRVRATNLKDSLMQRLPGFSERRYGFAKFKDLLISAERSGLIGVTAAGPVHWISLPHVEQPPTETPPAKTETTAAEETELAIPPRPSEGDHSEMIKFVFDLRHRSRWLTYTYVLTNLISHFARSLPQSAAESQARATLNYLVQEGILRVDKEPQEVEVGGARHRVRMCHMNTEHPLVVEALGPSPDEELSASEEPALPDQSSSELLEPGIESTETIGDHDDTSDLAEPGRTQTIGGNLAATVPDEGQLAVIPQPDNGMVDHGEDIARADRHGRSRGDFRDRRRGRAPSVGVPQPQPPQTPPLVVAPETTAEPTTVEGASGSSSKLDEVFGVLGRVVREAAAKDKRMMSGSTVRTRLTQALGTFNERDLGFSRFKDFLAAAQDAGVVRIQVRGHVTLVAPAEGTDSVTPAEG